MLLLAAAALIAPRVQRTIDYHKIVSKPSTSHLLNVQPMTITPSYVGETETVNTGYASFAVPSNTFHQLHAFETWLDLRANENCKVLLTEVHYDKTLSPDGNFTFTKNALNTFPLGSAQVFSMSQDDLTQHTLLLMTKLSNSYVQRGIAFFENEQTKGFIRYGSDPYFSDGTHIIVWDKQWPLCQEIALTIPDPQLRKDTAHSIAASYAFTVTSLPDRGSLIEMAEQAVKNFNTVAR